ncbi:MAG TPA: sulfatase-like hydrolase/transferase [Puia sp.]|nr:sulfatase-like hydrolase/transferase [Puia sp.]
MTLQLLKPVLVLAVLLVSASPIARQKRIPARQPNVILIIADDLGYSDLASYGNKLIHTPNIDGLAVSGIRFTRAYVTSPICSPSRMGIMTGRCQNRFGSEFMPFDEFDPAFLKNLRKHYFSLRKKNPGLKELRPNLGLNRHKYQTGLSSGEITLAELLKKNGYTTGLVGKWNLGDNEGNHPFQRGFDYSYYFDGALTRYVDDPVDTSRYVNQHLPWAFSELPAWTPRAASTAIREAGKQVTDTGYLTLSLAEKGVAFIEKNKDHPFFLTLAFNAPHDPFQVPKTYFDRVQSVSDTLHRVYFGMIEALDDAVGQILQKLKDTHLDDQTLILFISDNGGATYTRATDNAPLRGGKCTHFEGGLMVPFFLRYPGAVGQGLVFDKPVSSLDIFATAAAVTHTDLPADRIYDGVDLLPFLGNSGGFPHDLFFWRSGYSRAICKGDWKLYINKKDKKTFLFNLAEDIEEKHDLSAAHPEKVQELLRELEQWEKTQTVPPAWPSAADVLIDVRGERFHFPS